MKDEIRITNNALVITIDDKYFSSFTKYGDVRKALSLCKAKIFSSKNDDEINRVAKMLRATGENPISRTIGFTDNYKHHTSKPGEPVSFG